MIHEHITKVTHPQRRPPAPSMIARKSSGSEPSGAYTLRQRLGNRGVQRLMSEIAGHSTGSVQTRSPAIQAKLAVSQAGDVHEREADRVADAVMRTTVRGSTSTSPSLPTVQRACAGCENEMPTRELADQPVTVGDTAHVHRSASAGGADQVSAPVTANIRGMQGGGAPLPTATRAFFEPRFGADFSQVRVHADAHAADTAKSINAKAFTVGRDIAFSAGQYAPESSAGQHLLAHELTHVVQQQGGGEIQRQSAPGDFLDDLGKDFEKFAKGLSEEAEKQVRQQLKGLGALPGTGALFTKPGCPKNFCNPFADVGLAKTNLVLTAPVLLLGIAKVVSPRVVPLWKDYLFGGSSPKNLTSSFGADFTASERTELTTNFILEQVRKEISRNHKAILPSAGPVTVDLTPRMTNTLAAINNSSHPNRMNFNKIGEIAGNIAGDIGKDQSIKIGATPSPFNDDRTATITAQLTRTATGIRVKPNIVFKIHDTIDLCPGNCGALTEQDATIPMSRFEATGLSGDVPFEIEFPAPAASLAAFDIPIAGPSPVKPKGGGKPKAPSKGKTPSKVGGKTSALSDVEPSKEPLVLEEFEKTPGSFDEPGPGFIAGVEIG